MSKTLGGVMFLRNARKFDYPFIEAIKSLLEFCDKVSVCIVPTGDTTVSEIVDLFGEHYINEGKLILRFIADSDWEKMEFHTKHRLSIFTNYAIEMLDTDYIYSCQADEITAPESYEAIRMAIQKGSEGYLCTRINLWKDAYHKLNVPLQRMPCSTQILRLAKTCYRAYDDSESIAAPCDSAFVDQIKIWHYGFIRKKEVHPEKIRQMQRDIFHVQPDAKLEGMGDFQWDRWFSEDDLLPVTEEHPPLIREWIKTRP